MCVKIRFDVRKPLKRKKKITKRNLTEFVVACKYERLEEFCFRFGLVSHIERFYRRTINEKREEVMQDWGNWLRAPPKRQANQSKSKWLRDDGDA